MLTIFSGETEQNLKSVMNHLTLDLISDRDGMLEVLAESKARGTAVGVCAPLLGQEMFVTAVEDILTGDEVTIVLKNYDKTGYMLETNKLKLAEITSVCPFKSVFENPYLRGLAYSKPLI